jgi:hypothetical protein
VNSKAARLKKAARPIVPVKWYAAGAEIGRRRPEIAIILAQRRCAQRGMVAMSGEQLAPTDLRPSFALPFGRRHRALAEGLSGHRKVCCCLHAL